MTTPSHNSHKWTDKEKQVNCKICLLADNMKDCQKCPFFVLGNHPYMGFTVTKSNTVSTIQKKEGDKMDELTRSKIVAALILYDGKQAKKKGYNPHALPLYLQALDNFEDDLKTMSLRETIVTNYNGRLADAILKALNLESYTKEDARK